MNAQLLVRLGNISLFLLLVVAFYYALVFLLPVFVPFLIALILAVLIEPVNQFLMRWKKIRRPYAVAISNSFFLALFVGLLTFLGFKVTAQLIALIEKLKDSSQVIESEALTLFRQLRGLYLDLPPQWIVRINDALSGLVEQLQKVIASATGFLLGLISGLPGFLLVTLVVIISFVLISYHLPRLREQFLSFFSQEAQAKVNRILDDLNSALIGFVRAQVILSLMTYLLTLIGLLLLGVNYALAIALIITVVDILPIVGTGTVIVPWALFLFSQGNPSLATGLLILYVALTVIRRIVEPKILGHSIGLSALATIVSLYLGLNLLGGWGIFLGPILFIILKSVRRAGLLQIKFHF